MFDGFKRDVFTLGDTDIAFVVGGSGPPVLLLHGFPQCLALWGRVAPLLADRFTVICADLRGCVMARHFDITAEWRKRCADVSDASLPGGHFFIDQMPDDTARVLGEFLQGHSA